MSDQVPADVQHYSDEGHAVYDTVVPIVKESKAGYKTSEFWVAIVAAVLINVQPAVPEKWQAITTAALAGLYALSRGAAKAGVPEVDGSKV